MRCPKCGFITFDHLDNCVKCKKSIKAKTSNLHGSIYSVELPHFLKLEPNREEEETDDIDLLEESMVDLEDVVDKDLNVLMGAPGTDKVIELADDEEISLEVAGANVAEEQQDREIEIDFSSFDNDDKEVEIALDENPGTDTLKLEIPDELIDMSDLEPPKEERRPVAPETAMAKQTLDFDDEDALDIDLDLDLDLDLDSSKPAAVAGKSTIEPEEQMLSLDDLDFSEDLPTRAANKEKSTGIDMDGDLDFDLDLGGLSIHKKV